MEQMPDHQMVGPDPSGDFMPPDAPGMPGHPQMMAVDYEDIIGAIKVTDGIFVGDRYAAKDLHFIVQNKVTHIINCAGLQVRNHFENSNEEALEKKNMVVQYLTFLWIDTDSQGLFDEEPGQEDESLKIYNFILEAVSKGESCLVHCDRGQSRAAVALSAYYMRKFRWSLCKTLEFLSSRRPDLEIRASFIRQLNHLEKRLVSQSGVHSDSWTEMASRPHLENQELIITHTFLNSQVNQFQPDFPNPNLNDPMLMQDGGGDNDGSGKQILWKDKKGEGHRLVHDDSTRDLLNQETVLPVTTHKTENPDKGIMKVTKDPFYAECFPGGSEEEDKPETPIENVRPELPSELEIASEGNMFMEDKQELSQEEGKKEEIEISVEEERKSEPLPRQSTEEEKLAEGDSEESKFKPHATGESSDQIMIQEAEVKEDQIS